MGQMAVELDGSSCIIVAQPLVEQNNRFAVVRRIRRRAEACWPKLWVCCERACISLVRFLAVAAGNVAGGLMSKLHDAYLSPASERLANRAAGASS
jgi:hypothetical protein